MSVTIATGQDLPTVIREPRLRRLYDYWDAARRRRRFPSRRDIDPLDFPYILGNVMLVDVLDDPPRFRVHGTNLVARSHYDLTGKLVDELPLADYRDLTLKRCHELAVRPQPLWVEHDRMLDDRIFHYQALWLPFSDDDATVSMLMCALIYEGDRGPNASL